MSKSITAGNAIVCDYAANGQGGKHILVNVYSGSIIVQSFPARIRLGLYLELFFHEQSIKDLEIKIEAAESTLIKTKANAFLNNVNEPLAIVLQQFDCLFERECSLTVTVSAQGYVAKQLLNKKVCKGVVATPAGASPP